MPSSAETVDHEPVATAQTESLYREHGDFVVRLCRFLLRDRVEAEDAAQQVFLSAHRALLNGVSAREPRAWLAAITRNECFHRRRRPTTEHERDGDHLSQHDAAAEAVSRQELSVLWAELALMTRPQRDAFLLREIRGLSYAEVGSELSLSAPSVRSLLLRARTRLRDRLGDLGAAVSGLPWAQLLLRTLGGEDSPVPTAAKIAVVGVGATAVFGHTGVPHQRHILHGARPAASARPNRTAEARARARAHRSRPQETARTLPSRLRIVVRVDERHGETASRERSGKDGALGGDAGDARESTPVPDGSTADPSGDGDSTRGSGTSDTPTRSTSSDGGETGVSTDGETSDGGDSGSSSDGGGGN